MVSKALAVALLFIAGFTPLRGQGTYAGKAVIITEPDNRSGPRFGIAYLTRGSQTAAEAHKAFSNLTSLFGWQFEHGFPTDSGMPTLMTEFVVLVGGLEQNVPLPSATWLVGLRKQNGVEFGVGPTVTGTGTQIAFAGGVTQQLGSVNVPVNVAVAPARKGVSLSVTAGFNLRR
jgi:hypothetical protein